MEQSNECETKLIDMAKDIIYPERMRLWSSFAKSSGEDIYGGSDASFTLRAVDMLQQGKSFDEVYNMMCGLSVYAFGMILCRIAMLTERGAEFFRYTYKRDRYNLTEEIEEKLQIFEKDNAKYAKAQKKRTAGLEK